MDVWQQGFLKKRHLLQLILLYTAWEMGTSQLYYSVLEESQQGTFVGHVAQDLDLDTAELVPRMFRMESEVPGDYFEVNVQNGILFVNSRIDREELCSKSPVCTIHLEVILDKPLRMFHIEVEIKDINDNPPVFSKNQLNIFISESTTYGSHFLLESASDADIGKNGLITYTISPNEYFGLVIQNKQDKIILPELVLKKTLDREYISLHYLLLTATDGGQPEFTESIQIVITVLDVNDNRPVFNQSVYEIRLPENSAIGTLIATLEATDPDEGINKDIIYSFKTPFPSNVLTTFEIDENTGEVKLKTKLDFEDVNLYEIQVQAIDKGHAPMEGNCKLLIQVLDMNDNSPEMILKSLSLPVLEDSPPGTVVALISISDRDSGANGQVSCSMRPLGLPFKLLSTFKNYYSVIVAEPLDREKDTQYKLIVTAQDQGVPSLSTSSSFVVTIGDVNDNAPAFPQKLHTIFVKENNPPGAHIFTVSASDPDMAENAQVSYWLDETFWPLSSYISVHSESGKLYALQSLDYEELKLLEFQVKAKDAGLPALSGNVTVQIFVVDENDNAPSVIMLKEEVSILLVVPVVAEYVVGKIRALDADSGFNAWLNYELHEGTIGPWQVGLHSGEISTTSSLDEAESSSHILLVLVKDHGEPALSATATMNISLVSGTQAVQTDAYIPKIGGNPKTLAESINTYLIIAICSVSSLFLLAISLYVALNCQKDMVMYGPGTATLVYANDVGSWSYSKHRGCNLGNASGETGIKGDLMVFSPNFPVLAENGKQQDLLCAMSTHKERLCGIHKSNLKDLSLIRREFQQPRSFIQLPTPL
ncbi:protocadherin alpha-3-like [Python bivittatus]|uniref:Protocadherin alpha-3-like n=1 Tax=Python bivittatus TaxID=176946 RepID=A0A9F3W064_PYTBI|nr:protocadherin alpha-3-like [Python bivittatus]